MAKEHIQTVDRIKMEEEQTRTQQTNEILDYFGKFDKDLRPLNKDVWKILQYVSWN
jgi:Asp-tRNA(Asn)/Glu-tRNA(Gln) amidotransferase C subunit